MWSSNYVFPHFYLIATWLHASGTQARVKDTIANLDCAPGVACIHHYEAVLRLPFNRTDGGAASTYGDTNATSVPGFDRLNDYHFLSFDESFLSLVGDNASYEFFFSVEDITHEGPVWIPDKKWVVFTEINKFWQYRLDLSVKTPILSKFNASPPIWSPAGGSYHKGLVYFTCPGGGG
ncbi:lactonohydrolase [Penicillium subrubescens]|nr:lactonohydrolase [Penicillium subrubescens]KAJ5896641.1 lactonohydrolase [Penicillium subrubescens]